MMKAITQIYNITAPNTVCMKKAITQIYNITAPNTVFMMKAISQSQSITSPNTYLLPYSGRGQHGNTATRRSSGPA